MSEVQQETEQIELSFSYTLELWIYGVAFSFGLPSFFYTVLKLARTKRKHLVLAARLFSYKVTLTVADCIILFIYAPTQFLWIRYYWWFGGSFGCRIFKFISTFGFHLTANMQVLVAADRLLITAKMNRVSRNMKKRQYNTRLSLGAAWILALVCAFPQLLLFRQRSTPEGHLQCISVWTEHRVEYYDRLAALEEYDYRMSLVNDSTSEYYFSNGTLKYINPEKPNFSLEELNINNHHWLYLEQLYNVIHLATICVLPYTSELFCYTLIVYILKGATKGKFISLSDVLKEIFLCRCCSLTPRGVDSPTISNLTQESINLVSHSHSSLRAKKFTSIEMESSERRRAASIDVPKQQRNFQRVNLSIDDTGAIASSTQQLRAADKIKANVNTNNTQSWKQKITLFFRFRDNQSSFGHNENIQSLGSNCNNLTKSNTIWTMTVETARKNARWKAFIMLSLNIFFWAPYCILAITSSVVVEPWLANVQFVNALVTLNAVSNIIL